MNDPRSRLAAFSLIEVIVSSALLVMLLGALHNALQAGLQTHRRIEAELDMESQALTSFTHLRREIMESSLQGIEAYSDQGLTFMTPRTQDGNIATDGEGHLIWHKVVFYRIKDGVGLGRQEMMAPPNGTPPVMRLNPALPSSLDPARGPSSFGPSIPTRTIASKATGFNAQLLRSDPTSLKGVVDLAIEFETEVNNRKYGLVVKARFSPRN